MPEVDDNNQQKTIQNIVNLLAVPGVTKSLLTALQQVEKEFKEKYNAQILRYRLPNKSVKTHQADTTEFLKGLSKIKTIFFDLSGEIDKNGVKWKLVKPREKEGRYIVDKILAEFIKKLDRYKTLPNQIQDEILEPPNQNETFRIRFTKKSTTRVVGFIKKIEKENFVLQDDTHILKVSNQYKNLKKEDMYDKIKTLMKTNPELIEDIFFYSFMVLKQSGGLEHQVENPPKVKE